MQGEWKQVAKDHLALIKAKINECLPLLELDQYQHAKYRCTYILDTIDEPWTHPTLKSILESDDSSPTTEQLEKGR